MSHALKLADITAEADRTMTVCNACRYCEGFCPVFPAMAARRTFDATTLDYLANLCHNCTACYHACQYKPPHELDINVPAAFTALRAQSYAKYAWPQSVSRLFHHNALIVSATTVFALGAVIACALALLSTDTLTTPRTGPGAFYAVISHEAMVGVAAATFGFGVFAIFMSAVQFCRANALNSAVLLSSDNWLSALKAAASLEHLGGGHGEGCNTDSDAFSNARRIFHQFTMWGFLLCFAATCAGTFYEYVLGRLSPFPLLSFPVVLGTLGGVGLVVGPVGLLALKRRSDAIAMPRHSSGMDYAFLILLLLISLTGLALLALRESAAMPWLLVIHLGFVLAFFLTLPYSKFVHGVYRLLALVRYAQEQSP